MFIEFLKEIGTHPWADQLLKMAFERNYKCKGKKPYNHNIKTFSDLRKGYLLIHLQDWGEGLIEEFDHWSDIQWISLHVGISRGGSSYRFGDTHIAYRHSSSDVYKNVKGEWIYSNRVEEYGVNHKVNYPKPFWPKKEEKNIPTSWERFEYLAEQAGY